MAWRCHDCGIAGIWRFLWSSSDHTVSLYLNVFYWRYSLWFWQRPYFIAFSRTSACDWTLPEKITINQVLLRPCRLYFRVRQGALCSSSWHLKFGGGSLGSLEWLEVWRVERGGRCADVVLWNLMYFMASTCRQDHGDVRHSSQWC
jgi:hypothetical protein